MLFYFIYLLFNRFLLINHNTLEHIQCANCNSHANEHILPFPIFYTLFWWCLPWKGKKETPKTSGWNKTKLRAIYLSNNFLYSVTNSLYISKDIGKKELSSRKQIFYSLLNYTKYGWNITVAWSSTNKHFIFANDRWFDRERLFSNTDISNAFNWQTRFHHIGGRFFGCKRFAHTK